MSMQGLDIIIGAYARPVVLGDDVPDWDKHKPYEAGNRVSYNGAVYRASRHIDHSWWGNDKPDSSDAWGWITSGPFDIAAEQQKMNGLKTVTLAVARDLLAHGQAVIGRAIAKADADGLPGPTARKNCQDHLKWHADKLSSLTGDPNATIYDSADDLKKWTMQAFIEANSVDEGDKYLGTLVEWNKMWTEIEKNLQLAVKFVAQLPGKALEAATGIPWWAWYAGAGVVLVGLGIVVYKVATGPVGGAVAKHYLSLGRS